MSKEVRPEYNNAPFCTKKMLFFTHFSFKENVITVHMNVYITKSTDL